MELRTASARIVMSLVTRLTRSPVPARSTRSTGTASAWSNTSLRISARESSPTTAARTPPKYRRTAATIASTAYAERGAVDRLPSVG